MVRNATKEGANLDVKDLPKLGRNEDATNLCIDLDLAWQE